MAELTKGALGVDLFFAGVGITFTKGSGVTGSYGYAAPNMGGFGLEVSFRDDVSERSYTVKGGFGTASMGFSVNLDNKEISAVYGSKASVFGRIGMDSTETVNMETGEKNRKTSVDVGIARVSVTEDETTIGVGFLGRAEATFSHDSNDLTPGTNGFEGSPEIGSDADNGSPGTAQGNTTGTGFEGSPEIGFDANNGSPGTPGGGSWSAPDPAASTGFEGSPEVGANANNGSPGTPGGGNHSHNGGGGNHSGGAYGGHPSGRSGFEGSPEVGPGADNGSTGTPGGGSGGGGGGSGKPILLDLDGDGFETVPLDESSAFFDINGDGYRNNMGWLSGDDGFLAYDKNGDGLIAESDELSFTSYVEGARTDLEGLKHFDSNEDGVLDKNDAEWAKFGVWRDLDQDGEVDEGEFESMEEVGVASLALSHDDGLSEEEREQKLSDGELIVGEGSYTKQDGSEGRFADAILQYSDFGWKEEGDDKISIRSESGQQVLVSTAGEVGADVVLSDMGWNITGYISGSMDDILKAGKSRHVILDGGAGSDVLEGGTGDDWLVGNAGADSISGGMGHDILFVDAEDIASGFISGGEGYDVAILSGEDDFSLKLSNMELEAVHAGSGNDTLDASGLTENVVLDSGAGQDTLTGGAGSDVLVGGEGKDTLSGGAGHDILVIDSSDEFSGGDGVDQVIITTDEDINLNVTDKDIEIFFSGDGDDVLSTAMERRVMLHGGGGDDTLSGGWGDDVLLGGTGEDTLMGGYGNDTYHVSRGDGHDVIIDQYADVENGEYNAGQADVLQLGYGVHVSELLLRYDGTDLAVAFKEAGWEEMAFDDLADVATLENWSQAVRRIEYLRFDGGTLYHIGTLMEHYGVSAGGGVVDLGAAMAALEAAAAAGGRALAAGTDGTDLLAGGAGAPVRSDALLGLGGDDVLAGGLDGDLLDGGDGRDRADYGLSGFGVRVDLAAGEASALLAPAGGEGGAPDDASGGAPSGDTLAGIEDAAGTAFGDVLAGDGGDNRLYGRGGDDTLSGGGGADSLYGGAGYDVADFSWLDGSDAERGAYVDMQEPGRAGGLVLSGIEGLSGSRRGDVLLGDGGGNLLLGGAGDDTLRGREGDDTLDGGAGDDTLDGGAGLNTYVFGWGGGRDAVVGSQSSAVGGGGAGGSPGTNAVRLGAGVEASEVLVRRSSGGFEFGLRREGDGTAFGELADRLTLEDWGGGARQVLWVEFERGLSLDLAPFIGRMSSLTAGGEVAAPLSGIVLEGMMFPAGTAGGMPEVNAPPARAEGAGPLELELAYGEETLELSREALLAGFSDADGDTLSVSSLFVDGVEVEDWSWTPAG